MIKRIFHKKVNNQNSSSQSGAGATSNVNSGGQLNTLTSSGPVSQPTAQSDIVNAIVEEPQVTSPVGNKTCDEAKCKRLILYIFLII